jgi:hypothetical protein
VVSCSSTPEVSWYTRESPMLKMIHFGAPEMPARAAPVTVVPVPLSVTPAPEAMSSTARLSERSIDSASRSVLPASPDSRVTTAALATSPAECPPMPSATAKTGG